MVDSLSISNFLYLKQISWLLESSERESPVHSKYIFLVSLSSIGVLVTYSLMIETNIPN